MRYGILMITLAVMVLAGCGGTAITGVDGNSVRTITYEFSGSIDSVKYAEWTFNEEISQGEQDMQLPFSITVPVDARRIHASVEKYDTTGRVTIAVYENGQLIGGGTCPDGELGLIWME